MITEWPEFRKMALDLSEDGYIPIFGEFNEQLEEVVIQCILLARKKDKDNITLLINSNGGFNVIYAAIKSAMIESGIEFTGLVSGKAYSNGFNILQQCNRKLAVHESLIMFHWGRQYLNNNELAAIVSGETWPIDNAKREVMYIAEQASDRSGVPIEKLIEFALYERYFSAEEALRLNFIDEIIKDLPQKVKEAVKSKKPGKK